MIMLCLIGMFAGLALVYATWQHQRVLAKPLAVLQWRALGLVLMVVSVMVGVSVLPVAAAFLVWLFLMMLVIAALPFVPALLASNTTPQREC